MRIELINNSQKINVDQNTWNRLVSQSVTNTPFQTHEWVTSWWSVFGHDYSLLLLLGYESEKLVGIAPFMIDQRTKKNELRFISDVNGDYCDFIVSNNNKQKFLKSVFHRLFEIRHEWKTIFLKNIPEHSNTISSLQEILPGHDLPFEISTVACPVLKLHGNKAGKQWKTSRTLKRHLNFFKKNGDLAFHIYDSVDEAEQALDTLFEQHVKRWSFTQSPSLFRDQRYREFYHRLLRQAWPSGWLFFSCLRFNQKVIACHFGFDYQESVIWYKPSFDIGYRNRSPGRLLIHYIIEYSLQNKRKEFDFTVGDEPFKRLYTKEKRLNYNIHIYTNKKTYFLFSFLHSIIKIAKKLVWRPSGNQYLHFTKSRTTLHSNAIDPRSQEVP